MPISKNAKVVYKKKTFYNLIYFLETKSIELCIQWKQLAS